MNEKQPYLNNYVDEDAELFLHDGIDLSKNHYNYSPIDGAEIGNKMYFLGNYATYPTTGSAIKTDDVVAYYSSNWTWAAWIKYDTPSGTYRFLSNAITISRRGIFYRNTTIVYYDGDNNANYLSNDVNDDIWHHICFIERDGTLYYYLDGDLYDTVVISGGKGIAYGQIGGRGSSYSFPGYIQDVKVYHSAKSENWPENEYEKGIPDDSLQLYIEDGDKDLSKNNYSLTNNGAIIGNGMEFGQGKYIQTGIYPDADLANSSTSNFWLYMDGFGINGGIVIYANDFNNHRYYLGFYILFDGGEGLFHFYIMGGVGNSYEYQVSEIQFRSSWNMFTMVTDSGTSYFYFNGEYKGSFNYSFSGTSSSELTLNIDSPAWYTIGTVKDLKIYSEAKSADWVSNYYNLTRARYV